MLHSDLALALDPALIFERMGLDADAWQLQLLRSASPRIALNITRQAGKSTACAALAVWMAVYQSPALILLLSPALRQSQELFKKVMDCYRALGLTVPTQAETALRLELSNGSRIISLPGKEETIRGYSGVSLLIVDEASRVEDELYYSVLPMLAVSGGRLVVPSTPFGKRGWWHEEWVNGAGWERMEIPATDCPRISPAFLAEVRASMGDWWYQQEFMCQFSSTVDQVFDFEFVNAAITAEVEPLFPLGVPYA